jgi:hypothetical protein
VSALCPETRAQIRDDHHGLIYLMEAIDLILKNNAEAMSKEMPNKNKKRSKGSRRGRRGISSDKDGFGDDYLVSYFLDDKEVDLSNEVLKVLFNLSVSLDRDNVDEVMLL